MKTFPDPLILLIPSFLSFLLPNMRCVLGINNSDEQLENVTLFEYDFRSSVVNVLDETYDNTSSVNLNISTENNESRNLFQNRSYFNESSELDSQFSVTEESENSLKSEINQKFPRFIAPDEDICSCDLLYKACDINCCCDLDCTEEDIKVFSACQSQILTPDKNYCYQKDIIFRNNTVYKMTRDPESSLFCIVHDNFKEHLRFKDIQPLKSHRDLYLLLKYQYKTIYSWDRADDIELQDLSQMRAGSPIYIDSLSAQHKINNSHWTLPSSCLSNMCSCDQKVLYLEDFKSSCAILINDLEKQCETNSALSGDYYTSFCISTRSASSDIHTSNLADLIVHTKVINLNDEASNDDHSSGVIRVCVPRNVIRPTKKATSCDKVVSAVHFYVEHDGINGIHSISTQFQYTNISFNDNIFTQYFTVDFQWRNITDVLKKSGNPGYKVGLPILAGTNNSNAVSEDETIAIQKGGLSILGRDSNGLCTENRKIILFGKNFKIGCRFKILNSNCKTLKKRIFDLILGPSKKDVFVGIFGNANISNPDDWVEVYHEGQEASVSDEKCFASLALQIDIAYTAVGTTANPQFKIIGVGYHYMKPEYIDISCSPQCPDILLSTSVSFFDVTQPAIPHYAKIPSIKANLPDDFFYPFLYGSGTRLVCNVYLVTLYSMLIVAYMKKLFF